MQPYKESSHMCSSELVFFQQNASRIEAGAPKQISQATRSTFTRACWETINKLYHSVTLNDSKLPCKCSFKCKFTKTTEAGKSSDSLCVSLTQNDIREILKMWDAEVLSCLRHIFSSDVLTDAVCDRRSETFSSWNHKTYKKVDCQCNKPCEVPSSPSVLDATLDVGVLTEDCEIFSSGDELDKLESDTDSQDTVIEGEAYKRIRSVAIKERILHANEELFGVNFKEMYFDQDGDKTESISKPILKPDNTEKTVNIFLKEQADKTSWPCPNVKEAKLADKEEKFLMFIPTSTTTKENGVKSSDNKIISKEMSQSHSYKVYNESMCSSESSDNGSDGEEIALSDTSTSSDEATYVTSTADFCYYRYPVSCRLHTIAEESCEESERSSRGATPTNRGNLEFKYLDKTQVPSINIKKTLRKPIVKDVGHLKNGKDAAAYMVLATSRLEKYFESGLVDNISCPEGDLTDESGGVSSDDDLCHVPLRNKPNSEVSNRKIFSDKYSRNNHKVYDKSMSELKASYKDLTDSSLQKKFHVNSKTVKQPSVLKRNENSSFLHSNKGSFACDSEQTINIDFSSDDDAKYITNHLMQHINSNSVNAEPQSEVKSSSPLLKILESEIAHLMLTVSPIPLSVGEPSSSCSSTIGSNNSDYGSDTLESAEDISDNEIVAEVIAENRLLDDPIPSVKQDTLPGNCDAVDTANRNIPSTSRLSDSGGSEETLYICKQLIASLKRITNVSHETASSDNLCTDIEDASAKQYITDQIISLMQTVSASHNSPSSRTFSSCSTAVSDASQDCSDSDSPLIDEKRSFPKSKTPSESGSETTISASISIPSYDDSDRTPTESEVSHEMDELYALLENNTVHQDVFSAKFSCDLENFSHEKLKSVCNRDINTDPSETQNPVSESRSSLLSGAITRLETLLPITIEERIARYKDTFMTKNDCKEGNNGNETRINVILPQPSMTEVTYNNDFSVPHNSDFLSDSNPCLKAVESCDTISSSLSTNKNDNSSITSVKIISNNTHPLSSAIQKFLWNNLDSKYIDQKLDSQIEKTVDEPTPEKSLFKDIYEIKKIIEDESESKENEESIVTSLPKVINPKEKASSENDLLVANYRAKCKGSKFFGTKSVGNISELESNNNRNAFRDTGYYSFKSSEESFLSLGDSTASQTSTASLTQYKSLTSSETIQEEEESYSKGANSTKMSLSSSNIPDAVCGTPSSKSSTLPLSVRGKLATTPGRNHRSRSSFFSTSGVLRKLAQLRDESGNSLRSTQHGRLRMRNRSLSGGSEDGRQRKASVPGIVVSEFAENRLGQLSAGGSEKDGSGIHEDEIDQAFAYHCRSQMSLSSFGARSESITSVYSAAGGGRYGTVVVTGEILFGLIYNYIANLLEIHIKECRNLAAVDIKKNRSDPYVKVYLLPDRTKGGKRKTKVRKHSLNPVFDEFLKFPVAIHEVGIRTLWISVWHSDRFGRNDFLGEVMLPLSNSLIENMTSKWYPLQERMEILDAPVSYKGDLVLALKYVPPDVASRKFSKKAGLPVKGALEVLIREAHNLMATRSNGTSDPFCKSYLLPDKSKTGKQKTSVLKKTCNPNWNHTFIYDDLSLDDLRERCLELTIWDYDKITSNDFLGGVRLCLGTGKYQGRDADWMDSMGEERSLWYTMLERPNMWVDGSLLLRPNMQTRRIL